MFPELTRKQKCQLQGPQAILGRDPNETRLGSSLCLSLHVCTAGLMQATQGSCEHTLEPGGKAQATQCLTPRRPPRQLSLSLSSGPCSSKPKEGFGSQYREAHFFPVSWNSVRDQGRRIPCRHPLTSRDKTKKNNPAACGSNVE